MTDLAPAMFGPAFFRALRVGLGHGTFRLNKAPADLFITRKILWITVREGLQHILDAMGFADLDVKRHFALVLDALASCPEVAPDENGRLHRWIRPWPGMANPISAIAVHAWAAFRRGPACPLRHRWPIYEYDPRDRVARHDVEVLL